jgi:transposase
MGKRIEVSTQTIEQLVYQYKEEEKPLKELSALHALSITKIRNILIENKVKLRKTGTHNYFTTDGRKVKDVHKEVIKAYKAGKSLRKVALDFGVSYQTISNILDEHKIDRRSKGSYGKLTEKDKQKICKKYDTTNIRSLAESFDVSVATVLKVLKASNIEVTHGRKYKLNQEAFDELNETNAYWLGFLYARGNIKSQNHFDIYFHDNMAPIVNRFRTFLQSNQPFLIVNLRSRTSEKEYVLNRLAISSTKLVSKLCELGVNKVSDISYPKQITNDKLDKEFIAGYFDGCGTICNNRPDPYIQLRSNIAFLGTINKIIAKNTGKLKHEIIKSDFNSTYGKLRYTGKDSVTKVKKFLGRENKR